MSWSFVAATLAAMSAGALPEEAPQQEIIAQEAPAEASKTSRIVLALAATAAAMAVAEDSGETLEIHPLQFARISRDRAPQFQLGGVGLSFAAYRSKIPSDASGFNGLRSDSRAMGKFLPGYPQPAKVVVGLKVSF